MLISGFTMVRNADRLYFPVQASITSALPIVDEFIVALGKGDAGDKTESIVKSISSEKIKIYDRIWDEKLFLNSTIFAHETDVALNQCKSTWCLYLQADEVLHENDLPLIKEYCEKYKDDLRVEGMIFNYHHFWGDYGHVMNSHAWYRKEIRIVRNKIGAYSYKDAVSFRKGNNEKLKVIQLPCHIFHYGYVRPPQLMATKKKVHDTLHSGKEINTHEAQTSDIFDYGPLGSIPEFKGTHPKVMEEWIGKINWKNSLNYNKLKSSDAVIHKHQKLKYRILSKIEEKLNKNEQLFGFKNYELIRI